MMTPARCLNQLTMKPTNTHLILLADDDEDDQLLIGALIRQHCADCTFETVDNGQALLDRLGEDRPLPALILLDLNMPLLGGLDVLRHRQASEHLRSIPVIVLTTSAEETDVNRSYALGANAFLTKPGNYDELADMILHLRDFWLKQARLPTPEATILN